MRKSIDRPGKQNFLVYFFEEKGIFFEDHLKNLQITRVIEINRIPEHEKK
jgi:hypothetical protein